jgi:hypothetical protein
MTETTPQLSEILESERPRAQQRLSALAATARNHEDAKREWPFATFDVSRAPGVGILLNQRGW